MRQILSQKEAETLAKIHKDSIINNSFNEGIEKGIEQGIEQNTINMIKSILNNNANYEFISSVTGKTINEIKEIENM